jgi:predicted DNA-binding antitoxin AbrB/MazE fold protein
MTLTIEAVYENGVLKPTQPLPLPDQARVRLTLETTEDALARVRHSAGLLGWTGDSEVLRRVAEDPDFGILESP